MLRLADRLRCRLVESVDEGRQDLRGEFVLTGDGSTIGAGNVRHRCEFPQQLLELGFAVPSRPAETLQNAAPRRLPEARRIEELQQEEEPAAGLHPLADLAEQMGLAGACRAAHDHSQWAGFWVPVGVGERVHDLFERLVVDPGHVERTLCVPQVVGRRRKRQAKRLEGVPFLRIHHDSIAIRCLARLPISTAAAWSSSVKVF